MNEPTEYLILNKDLGLFFGGTYAQFEDCYGYAEAGGDPELELKFIIDFINSPTLPFLNDLNVYVKKH